MILLLLAASVSQVGTFFIGSTSDAMTDEVQAGAMLEGSDGRLQIFCNKADGRNTRILLQPEQPIETYGGMLDAAVQVRFDDEKPDLQIWKGGGSFVYLRSKRSVYDFADKLSKASRLRLRVELLSQRADLDFHVAEARSAITAVGQMCSDQGLIEAVSEKPK